MMPKYFVQIKGYVNMLGFLDNHEAALLSGDLFRVSWANMRVSEIKWRGGVW
jgi:hypothetical protein